MIFAKMNDEGTTSIVTSIMEFPLLVLSKVFKYLPSRDREIATYVCQQWEDIIACEVGLTRHIGEMRYSLPGHKTAIWRPINEIGRVGIDKCIFGELDDRCLQGSNEVSSFRFPELVREITFVGKIKDEHFRQIMSPVFWLNKLKIHLSVLRTVSFTKFSLKLCSLSHLKIFYTHAAHSLNCPFSYGPYMEREMVHRSLTNLLDSSYLRQIKIFEFVGPYFIEKMECLIDAVRAFARRHEKTLKELVLQFPYEWNVSSTWRKRSPEMGRSSSGPNWGNLQLTRLTIVSPATVVPPLMISEEDVAEEQITSAWVGTKLNKMLRSLLSDQVQLELLHYVNKHENWEFPEFIFMNCFSQLTTISISINSKHPADCRALAICKNLSKLVLEGNFFYVAESGAVQHNLVNNANNAIPAEKDGLTGLLNVGFLPQSLKEVCFSKLMIPVKEMNVIANTEEPKRFPNLVTLQLYQVCKSSPECGLSPSALQNLFDQNNLCLSIWQALNKPSFEEAIEKWNQNLIHPDVGTLMRIREHCDYEPEGGTPELLHFKHLNDCHVQIVRRKMGDRKKLL